MATQTTMLHVRVDNELKKQATENLASMGLSVSDAVRLFLHKIVVDQAFPFDLKVPNRETQQAMAEADKMISERQLRFAESQKLLDDIEENSQK